MGKTKDLDIFGGATKIKKLRMIVNYYLNYPCARFKVHSRDIDLSLPREAS